MKKRVLAIVAIVAIVAVMSVCLVACNADDYQKRLEKEGYSVVVINENALLKTYEVSLNVVVDLEGGLEFVVEGSNGDDNVTVYKFLNASDATTLADYFKSEINDGDDAKVVKSGKYVIAGTKEGVKAAM